MSDPHATAPSPSPVTAAATTSRGVKIALAVSVALNLAVAGLAAGAFLRDGPRGGMPREMSFGPFSEALDTSDRRAIRRALLERMGEFRAQREAAHEELQTLLAALRADPFDPAALAAALADIEARTTQRLELGRSLIEERLMQMSPEDRMAFADRLETALRRGGRN